MSTIPTQNKLWYIEYPVKIDGVTDSQVQEWAQHCALYAAINTETTDEDGYPIYEFQSYNVAVLLGCINRMLAPEGLTYTQDNLSFRMIDLSDIDRLLLARKINYWRAVYLQFKAE